MAELEKKNLEHGPVTEGMLAGEVLRKGNAERRAVPEKKNIEFKPDEGAGNAFGDRSVEEVKTTETSSAAEISSQALKHKKNFGKWMGELLTNETAALDKKTKDSSTAFEIVEGITDPELRKRMNEPEADDLDVGNRGN